MPEQTSMMETQRKAVRELEQLDFVDLVLLVRERDVRQKKDGSDYFALKVSDKTGETVIKVWSDSPGYRLATEGQFQPGQAVRVRGRYVIDEKWGAEIELKGDGCGIRLAQDDEIIWDDLLDGPARPVEELEVMLDDLVRSLGDFGDPLHDLVARVLGDCYEQFKMAPAARNNHQPYRHGLLEHTVNVAHTVSEICGVYPDTDRHVAVAGAIIHDVGKVDTYTLDPLQRDMTDAGRLYGEIPQSYYRVRGAIDQLWPDTPAPPMIAHVLHIVVSHHGQIEWGASVTPCTREAFLVHYADMIDSRMGGIERVEKRTQPGEEWTGYDRGINTRAWIPQPAPQPTPESAPEPAT